MRMLRVVAAMVLGALLFGENDLNSCSVEPLRAIFTAEISREGPDKDFAKGELGIVLPPFPPAYLALAYRYMSGGRLPADQISTLVFQRKQTPDPPTTSGAEDWQIAQQRVFANPVYVNPYKEDSELHLFFLNCKEDAFRAAAATLRALIRAYGVNSERMKQWLAAQDMVFQNCNAGPAIPQPLEPTADAAAKADRAYQVAAAHFYSGQYDAARTEFAVIGRDAGSPWRGLAPYLVARAMIRQGDLSDAEKQVLAILKDPKQTEGHERADHLEAWLKIRLYPAERLSETARAVMEPHPSDFQQSVMDYTYLFGQLEQQQGALDKAAEGNDLTDWILDFQHSDPVEGHALERWRATHSTPWLVAALAAKPDEEGVREELLKAADETPPQSPGYFTVQYYAVALMAKEAARARLDAALSAKPPRAARNLLLAARMRFARDWAEFLRDAQRHPVDVDGYDYSVAGTTPSHTADEIGLDSDGVDVLNHLIPLSLEAGAALDSQLPVDIRREVATAAWTKAVLLNQWATARKLGPVMAELYPTVRVDLDATDLDENEARFAAVLTMLRNPGLRPYVEAGFGRLTKMDRIDEFRDNWWCAAEQDRAMSYALSNLYGQEKPRADFLTAQEVAAAKAEDEGVRALAGAPDLLASETVHFAKEHPADARVPEALHLAVRATRYGCVSEHTSIASREAFELLHARYPNSEWARATPYWFKN